MVPLVFSQFYNIQNTADLRLYTKYELSSIESIILNLVSMESSHLVIFSTSGKFITKFNVLRCISLSETLFWTGARGRIPITLRQFHRSGANVKGTTCFYDFRQFSIRKISPATDEMFEWKPGLTAKFYLSELSQRF